MKKSKEDRARTLLLEIKSEALKGICAHYPALSVHVKNIGKKIEDLEKLNSQ